MIIDEGGLDQRLVSLWREAADDLGVRVTAPIELHDAAGRPFACEALVHDFGSPIGAVVISRKTERRVRAQLRGLGGPIWTSVSGRRPTYTYKRDHVMQMLLDWGWFGSTAEEPEWYSRRSWR
jgi:hypothetical protein